MATNYGYERGKYGVFAGTIIAFPRKLDGNDPNDTTWRTRVPAGYLRCDGSIKNGDDFPALKQILGVGAASKFRKTGTTLAEPNTTTGAGGQFQLPDLGSKYIRAYPTSGVYEYDTITNPINSSVVPKVGIGVDLTLNSGTSLSVNYSGNISVPSVTVPISSTYNFGTNLAYLTGTGAPDYTSFLPHGHYTNLVSRSSNSEVANCSSSDVSPTLTQTSVDVVDGAPTSIGGDFTGVQHVHGITRSTVSRSNTSNNYAVSVLPDNITTTVNISVQGTFKMDDIQPKFILVEYLIKI